MAVIPSSVLVTGATGFIGRALCAVLRERGQAFTALSRRPERAKAALPGVKEAWKWRPKLEPAPLAAIQGAGAVVHLAGESVAGRWTAEKKRAIRDTRVIGTRHLVEAIGEAKSKPGVLVCASAVGYYGDRGEEELTEEAGPGSDFLAEVCTAWEAEARRAEEFGVRVVMLRTGIVLGRGGGALKQMLLPFKLGLGGPLGSGKQWMPWVHLDDLVGIILHAIQHASVSGPVNATAPTPVRNREFTKALARVLHRPAILPAPAFGLKLLLGEFADVLLASQRVLSKRIRESGYTFRHPSLEPALGALLGR
ncbi:MAG: TIGR01777 family oxidoreductase [Candidatus Methylomirabilales bacterium]